ncbi:MAG: ethylbenzene dehydrogenase-related protein, partial [Desulfobulbales bacterium]|nr:ethylbenzene dehydrogenase-related protein [Desulfobulbales bacterium]
DAGETAYRINLISEYRGDTLPRYVLEEPRGSRSDVRAKGAWQNGRWTIEFGRKLLTGNSDDVQFNPDKKYLFGLSRYEIAGREANEKLSDPLYGTGDVSEVLWLQFKK